MKNVLLFLLLTSCIGQPIEQPEPHKMSTGYEEIQFSPMVIRCVYRQGMKYMIVTTSRAREAGVSTTNLTLDSLQCLYYRKQLKK